MTWPIVDESSGLSSSQVRELKISTRNRVGLLSGGPGTGKSYAIAKLVEAADDSIVCCAPTGRAATRIKEVLGEMGITKAPSTTIHRLLVPQRSGHDGEGWWFKHNETNPIEAKYVICDEASMCDNYIVRCLLAACRRSHILFVGDPDQLPPVGRGRPFLDMIASGAIPHGRFTETHRFSGRIAVVCKDINEGRVWQPSKELNLESEFKENLLHCESSSNMQSIQIVEKLIRKFRERSSKEGFQFPQSTQIIVPKNDKSVVSRKNLNALAQSIINRDGRLIDENREYRAGDKVICNTNSQFRAVKEYRGKLEEENYNSYVSNGDMGYIIDGNSKSMIINFESGGMVLISREEWNCVDLGYAITCHKSQGGQWPYMILVCDESGSARRICNRSWWYTGVSRAKRIAVTVGPKSIIDRDCKVRDVVNRRTHLAYKLVQKIPPQLASSTL